MTSNAATRSLAITGATGFVGSHLASLLRTNNHSVTALVRPTSRIERLQALGVSCITASLDDPASMVPAFENRDVVVHLAGAVDFHGDWNRFHQVNVEGTRNVLEAARRAGVRRVVVASSIVAVGATATPAIQDETSPWNLGPLRIPYVTTKRQAEDVALGERFGDVEIVVVNPSCVVGPDDDGSEFGVIMHRFWKGRVPFFFGGGTNFVDVRDIAQGLLAATQFGRPGERYLLTGTNVSWDEWFAQLSMACGRSVPRVRVPSAVGEWFATCESLVRGRGTKRPNLSLEQAKLMPLYFYFDHAKATRELGFEPRPLRETLRDAFASWQHEVHRAA